MINSTDDFLSFLQTNKPFQSKNPNSVASNKKVSFSNSVKFNDKGADVVQSQVHDETKVTSNNISSSQGRDEVEQRQDIFQRNLYEENSKRILSDGNIPLKVNEQVTTNSQNITDSQMDTVPSYRRSIDQNKALNGSLDMLFKNGLNFNDDRNHILDEKLDENKSVSVYDFKTRKNDLPEENHSTMLTHSALTSNISKMSRNDLHQHSFPRSNPNQHRIDVPVGSQENIESALNLVREETSKMMTQVMQHLDANTHLLQKIQETQSNSHVFDESIIKNDWLQDLRNHTAYVEDLCKDDKHQMTQTLARLDELLNYMKSSTQDDKARLREEISRISKVEETLATEREQFNRSQEVERKRMMEDRVAFDQWKHQAEEEIRRERESIQRRNELLVEKENELNRQYADMKLNMQALQYEKVSWILNLKN